MRDLIERQPLMDMIIGRTTYKSKREIMQRIMKNVSEENGWLGGIVECLDEIEDAPSAEEAIPVSWIYNYLSQWDEISNRYEQPFHDDALADREYWEIISRRAAIGMMVHAWHKEQEGEG